MSTRQRCIIAVCAWLLISGGITYQLGAASTGLGEPSGGASAMQAGGPMMLHGVTVVRPSSQTNTGPIGPAATILSEDFEGGWPAPGWQLSDNSSADGGVYLWGKRNCHPHGGTYGGFSAGGGTNGKNRSCSSQYPLNAFSWAIYGPFSLTNVSSASLSFYLWGRSEAAVDQQGNPFDYLLAGVSTDGSHFSGTAYWNDWTNGPAGNGYSQNSVDLSSGLGHDLVWIAFVFVTDNSVTDIGFTIDDITLDVDNNATPTPTSTPRPTSTSTPRPTSTSTPRATPTSTPRATPTSTPRATPTSTPRATPTPASAPGGPNYVPLIEQTQLQCNDVEDNNDTSAGAGQLTTVGTTCQGSMEDDPQPGFDWYFFDAPAGKTMVIDLSGIPAGADYDLYLFDANVHYVGSSVNSGNAPEHIAHSTGSGGRYYIRITEYRKSPAQDSYLLRAVFQ